MSISRVQRSISNRRGQFLAIVSRSIPLVIFIFYNEVKNRGQYLRVKVESPS